MGIEYGEKRSPFIDYGRPSLFLDFAKRKSLVDAISKNNLITFTRSSTGTYVGSDGLIKTAAADEARFDHDPETGESLGLLIEEQRTNLITYSENFNVSFWDKLYGTTIVPNDTISPDGSQTATRVYQSGTTNEGFLVKYTGGGLSVTTGQTYTLSFFTKKVEVGGLDRVQLSFDVSGQGSYPIGGNVWFNFSDPNSFLSNSGAFYEELSNGWYRIGLTRTATLDGTIEYGLTIDDSNSVGVYVWGIQLELGSFPTSYIPTSGSAVTRQPDNASIIGTNFSSWYNQSEGTIFAKYSAGTYVSEVPFSISKTGDEINQIIAISSSSTGLISGVIPTIVVTDDGVNQTGVTIPIYPVDGDVIKTAIAYKENDFAIASGIGGDVGFASDSSGTIPTVDFARIGKYPYYGIWQNRPIARIIYYPTRLTNTQLQALTQ